MEIKLQLSARRQTQSQRGKYYSQTTQNNVNKYFANRLLFTPVLIVLGLLMPAITQQRFYLPPIFQARHASSRDRQQPIVLSLPLLLSLFPFLSFFRQQDRGTGFPRSYAGDGQTFSLPNFVLLQLTTFLVRGGRGGECDFVVSASIGGASFLPAPLRFTFVILRRRSPSAFRRFRGPPFAAAATAATATAALGLVLFVSLWTFARLSLDLSRRKMIFC